MIKKDIKNQIKTYLIVCLALVIAGGFVVAANYTSEQNINVEGDYNYYGSNPEEFVEEAMGSGGPSLRVPWDFKEGIEVDGKYIVDGNRIDYYNISVDGQTDNRATTTADDSGTGISANGFAAITVAYWTNPDPDNDMIIEDLRIDVFETFSFAGSFSVASTTSGGSLIAYPYQQWRNATSGALTIIASTTVATTKDSKKTGFIGIENYPGTVFNNYETGSAGDKDATTTSFILGPGESTVVSWHPYGATSTRSFTEEGAFTGDFRLLGKAFMRKK